MRCSRKIPCLSISVKTESSAKCIGREDTPPSYRSWTWPVTANNLPMVKVVLIGTSHKYQIQGGSVDQAVSNQFERLLISLCSAHMANGIAEEMNQVALTERKASETIAQVVAVSLGIGHQLSDPIPEIRQRLGICSESEIRVQGWQQNWSQELIEAEVRKSHEIRENYWLAQLKLFNSWPTIFVCGAGHAEPFAALLRGEGLEVIIAASDWEPK